MIPKSFEEYYQTQTKKIVKHYDLARKFFDVEGIHEMRVEIKGLHAFLDAIAWINPEFQVKENFKKIRKVFKSAGKIRDIHVQQEITKNWIKQSSIEVSEYFNHLKQQELKKRQQFRAVCGKFKTNEFDLNWIKIRDALNILPQNFIQYKSEERFHLLVDNLISYKEKPKFIEEDYHKIRILSKETRYTLEILQTCFPEAGQSNELNLKIRELHRALGKWHDDEVGLLMLRDFMENFSAQPFFNRNSYDEFIHILEQDKKKWISIFEGRWKDFMEFLNQNSLNFIETKFFLN